ncbi:hypothetical protein RAJCM14343_1918 [Rhodococcus aetherivorans]|uniref:Uncharacterized protein n=1 Tax=Rhodococcus aetherivorans TaxID=191292 RepID=A0ABQ0YJD1_9NOCA|nr:hypothetical protein [Rhodococcus aetherivorans]ETT23695.1 hypothetical protein RR21198_0368 [Rhodococcus rhodochrous ATCC 21198]NGP27470.1 hypothetical protein [Rhodococcus aetherivorans]GES36666.1 hypothetical protein RAJCM14343_1918 [Rhodococcus aetherivorans]
MHGIDDHLRDLVEPTSLGCGLRAAGGAVSATRANSSAAVSTVTSGSRAWNWTLVPVRRRRPLSGRVMPRWIHTA